MIYNKKVLAIIPARGGSKGLKNKNIKIFNKKPLIYWTVKQALKSKYIDRLYVSTDSKKILNNIQNLKLQTPFLRPKKLSGDKAKSVDVVLFELKRLENFFKEKYDIIVLLEPTNPLRKKNDIDLGIKQLSSTNKFDSLISVGLLKFSPELLYSFSKNKKLKRIFTRMKIVTRRQDAKKFYYPTGGLYIVKRKNLLNEKEIYTRRCMGFLNDYSQTRGEIDNIFDFYSTEIIFKKYFKS